MDDYENEGKKHMISDIPHIDGIQAEVAGVVTSVKDGIACNGVPYRKLQFEDATGGLTAFAYADNFQEWDTIKQDELLKLQVSLHRLTATWVFKVHGVAPADSFDVVRQFPARMAPRPDAIGRLATLIESITLPPYRRFVETILASPSLAIPFITLPGSQTHHHAYAGGLLVHSVECAESIVHDLILRELGDIWQAALVAALLHDVGKIMEYGVAHSFHLNHKFLGAELLAPFMMQLDREWHDGADVLRHLLGSVHDDEKNHCWTVLEEAVRSADRKSSGVDATHKAFSNVSKNSKIAFFGRRKYVRLNYDEAA